MSKLKTIFQWTYESAPEYEAGSLKDDEGLATFLANNPGTSLLHNLLIGTPAAFIQYEVAGETNPRGALTKIVQDVLFYCGNNCERTFGFIVNSPFWASFGDKDISRDELKALILVTAEKADQVYRFSSSQGFAYIGQKKLVNGQPYNTEGCENDVWVMKGGEYPSIISNGHNLKKALALYREHGHLFYFDTFKSCLYYADARTGKRVAVNDRVLFKVRCDLEARYLKTIYKPTFSEAVDYFGSLNEYDSLKDYIADLRWDGVSRVSRFCADYMKTEDTPYAKAVSECFLTQMMGRIMVPGIQADMVPLYESKQGMRKSHALKALVGEENFCVLHLDVDNRDNIARKMKGKLLAELAEFSPGNSKKAIEYLRTFITENKEEWVVKFKEYTDIQLRRIVFAATVNGKENLNDPQGNRRWLPICVLAECDDSAIARDRDQLWAEAYVLYQQNGIMWQEAQRLAEAEHDKFMVRDVWEDAIRVWANTRYEPKKANSRSHGTWNQVGFTTLEAAVHALGFAAKDVSTAHENRLKRCLMVMGYKNGQNMRDGQRASRWTATTKVFAALEEMDKKPVQLVAPLDHSEQVKEAV